MSPSYIDGECPDMNWHVLIRKTDPWMVDMLYSKVIWIRFGFLSIKIHLVVFTFFPLKFHSYDKIDENIQIHLITDYSKQRFIGNFG